MLIQGKTLSLLCSALTWLRMQRRRAELGVLAPSGAREPSADTEPDWVVAHDEARQREALEAQEAELRERLRTVRERNAAERHCLSFDRKRARVDEGHVSDDDFLISTYEEDAYLAPEVREMMRELEANVPSMSRDPREEPETRPKIYYASRTHSQLAQLVHELQRTSFGRADADSDPVRVVNLGSRRQMCINTNVQRVGDTFGTEAMNERCLELMESKHRCPYLPAREGQDAARMDAFRDQALAEVRDIEELVQVGRRMRTCPYFGARNAARQAELVTLPYNLLLQKDAREALQLSLDENVVLIDEAHNLIDTILATYSTELSAAQIQLAASQVSTYLDRFASRLRGANEEHLRMLQVLLRGLEAFCAGATSDVALSGAELVARLGHSADQINVCVRL